MLKLGFKLPPRFMLAQTVPDEPEIEMHIPPYAETVLKIQAQLRAAFEGPPSIAALADLDDYLCGKPSDSPYRSAVIKLFTPDTANSCTQAPQAPEAL